MPHNSDLKDLMICLPTAFDFWWWTSIWGNDTVQGASHAQNENSDDVKIKNEESQFTPGVSSDSDEDFFAPVSFFLNL